MADPIERFFEPVAERLREFAAGMELWQVLGLFGLGVVAMLFFGSFASGWHRLAQHYPREYRFSGEWILMPDFDGNEDAGLVLDFNGQENENIDLGVDGRGLHLSMQLPFRLFHPPIFVPWSEVSSIAWAGIPWSDNKTEVRFSFARCADISVTVGIEVARKMEIRAAGAWKIPPGFDPPG